MKLRILIIAALGLALALYLVTYVGMGAVLSAAVTVGWSGFAILCLYALGVFLLLGAAWYVLPPDPSPSGPWVFLWARMVRDAAAEVLPFSQLGGIVLGARAAILHGVATPLAFASMIVDVTTEMLAQIVYIALGGLSAALHLAGWIASAIGAWIAFRLIGAHVDVAAVLAIESLVCATRSAAAFIPNALGVQEAAYTVLAPLFGIGAEFGLAVSLLKRARDIAVGVPILLIWQALEGRRALAARPGPSA